MRSLRFILSSALVVLAAGCAPGSIDDEEDGDTESALVAGDVEKLEIGFDGLADQFGYFADFYDQNVATQPRLCHGYIGWDVANQPPHHGDVADPDSRAYVEHWLASAAGACDEALVSFKTQTHGNPPTEAQFAAAFHNFVSADWASETGFAGRFSFTPWNEPNNAGDAGNGLGVQIAPRLAARYYLAAEKECRVAGCKVAAGDFASNGDMWNDLEWNCANDNVAESQLCKTKSSANKAGAAASYLDRYKNEIALHAVEHGLPAGFRPEYFAYHGWHDSNEHINDASHCSAYGDCALRRLLQSLGGSWGGVAIWDSEDGFGQNVTIGDREQACAAAFDLRLLTISRRVRRLYVTRLHGGGGQLLVGHTPRPAMEVLARRQRTYPAGECD